MKYYKVLRTNRASWHDKSFVWPLHKPVEVKDVGPEGPCGPGLHLARSVDDGFRYARFPARVFEVTPLGPVLGEDRMKIRVAKAQLDEEITLGWVRKVNAFIKSLKQIPWFEGAKPPRKTWRLFETQDAARDAIRNTVRNAARNAAWNAIGDTVRKIAISIARDIARDAVREAVWGTSVDASWDAAWDAGLHAQMLVCDGLDLDPTHVRHTRARMDVWRRGYGLLCDIKGVLYVYRSTP